MVKRILSFNISSAVIIGTYFPAMVKKKHDQNGICAKARDEAKKKIMFPMDYFIQEPVNLKHQNSERVCGGDCEEVPIPIVSKCGEQACLAVMYEQKEQHPQSRTANSEYKIFTHEH